MTDAYEVFENSRLGELTRWSRQVLDEHVDGGSTIPAQATKIAMLMAVWIWLLELAMPNDPWPVRYASIANSYRQSPVALLEWSKYCIEQQQPPERDIALQLIQSCLNDPANWKVQIATAALAFKIMSEIGS